MYRRQPLRRLLSRLGPAPRRRPARQQRRHTGRPENQPVGDGRPAGRSPAGAAAGQPAPPAAAAGRQRRTPGPARPATGAGGWAAQPAARRARPRSVWSSWVCSRSAAAASCWTADQQAASAALRPADTSQIRLHLRHTDRRSQTAPDTPDFHRQLDIQPQSQLSLIHSPQRVYGTDNERHSVSRIWVIMSWDGFPNKQLIHW